MVHVVYIWYLTIFLFWLRDVPLLGGALRRGMNERRWHGRERTKITPTVNLLKQPKVEQEREREERRAESILKYNKKVSKSNGSNNSSHCVPQ